jgi:hypothetical protein
MTNKDDRGTESYEPPAVEDLDTTHGPAATPAGTVLASPGNDAISLTAPRDVG